MTRIRFVLTLLAGIALASPAASAQQKGDATGKWAFSVVTENGTGTPTVTIKQDGEKLSGTYESARLGVRPLEGTRKGDAIRFVLKGSADGMPDLTFEGVMVDADNMKGTVDMGGMGSATFSGKRARS